MGNGGSEPTRGAFTILYNQRTQKYELEQVLQPDEQMWMDVGKVIREGTPDKNGKPLPPDLTSGSYEIRDLDNHIGTLFEGKVIYDKTYGHVTYGCQVCCGYRRFVMFYDPLEIPFTSTAGNGVSGQDACSLQYTDVSGDFEGDWSTANSSVATVDYYGTHTGQGVGSTTSDTFAEEEWYVSKYSCPIMQRHSRGAANVKPKILLGGSNGTDITNTTQNVVVGQQIILYGSYALPSGSTFTNQSWTIPNAWTDTSQPQTTVVGGFNVASDFSTGGPTPVTTTTQRTTTFYWVAAASSQTITFTLNYKDANGTVQHAAATTTFTVNGPTSLVIQTPEGQITVNPGPVLQFGGPNSNPTDGITFSASATPPTGFSNSFFWAQLILGDTFTFTTTGGTTQVCTVNSLGLDNTYPYYPPKDSPFFSLSSGDTKSTRNFSARMFVMWSSNLPNSIPVPVASVSWGFYADASFGSTWTVQSDSSVTTPTITTGATYPSWTSLYTNNGPTTCH